MTDAVICRLCALVYRDNPIDKTARSDGIDLLDVICDDETDTQLAVYRQLNTVAVVFRGTSSLRDVLTDINYDFICVDGIKCHEGFFHAWESVAVDVATAINQPGVTRVIFAGHSLGGAIANLAAYFLRGEVVTFGAPRVFNRAGARNFIAISRQYRNRCDPVPYLSSWWRGFRHVKKQIKFGHRGFFRIKYHRISNYLRFF